MKWYDHLRTLQLSDATPSDSGPDSGARTRGPCSDLAVVSAIRSAAAAAKICPDWKDSGVREMLLNALQIAEQGDCRGAEKSARGVLAFLQGRESALNRRLQNGKVPWDTSDVSSKGDASVATEALHRQSDEQNDPHHRREREEAAAIAVRDAAAAEADARQEPGSGGSLPGADVEVTARNLRKSTSDPNHSPPHKKQRGKSPQPHHKPTRSRSDPLAVNQEQRQPPEGRRQQQGQQSGEGPQQLQQSTQPTVPHSMDAIIQVAGTRPRVGSSLEPGSNMNSSSMGSIVSDEKFPGHNSVEDALGDGNQLRKAKLGDVDRASGSYWAGKVKHKLGASIVELFFLSVLLPAPVIEHMPPTLFVTDLVQRSSLLVDESHSVVRCRLDFVTNRQMRKLRTLADLRLAAVSTLQHSALTLVPFIDAIGGLRIIGFVKVEMT